MWLSCKFTKFLARNWNNLLHTNFLKILLVQKYASMASKLLRVDVLNKFALMDVHCSCSLNLVNLLDCRKRVVKLQVHRMPGTRLSKPFVYQFSLCKNMKQSKFIWNQGHAPVASKLFSSIQGMRKSGCNKRVPYLLLFKPTCCSCSFTSQIFGLPGIWSMSTAELGPALFWQNIWKI